MEQRVAAVHDAAAAGLDHARIAHEAGQLDREPAQVVFELAAIAAGLNQAVQLHCDARALGRARVAVERALA